MAGPYNMRITDKLNLNTRNRQLPELKGWVVVFVCLVTRAVHLEATEGLSTDDFLAAYERFVGRRGNPELIFSDNGTNFVGANNELKKAFETWQADKIQHWIVSNGYTIMAPIGTSSHRLLHTKVEFGKQRSR